MRILLVEDEKILSKSIKMILERAEYEVDTAYDGEEALEYAKTAIYDLMILDVMMPKLNGYQVARQLRKEKKWSAYSDAYRQKSAGGSYRRLGGGC